MKLTGNRTTDSVGSIQPIRKQPDADVPSSCACRGGSGMETKPELQRVLESRKRDQLIRQRKQEEEARRKISPLEAELLKRHMKLEELERQQEQQQEENLRAPEFVKVRENLRRTSFHADEKEV
uniref:Actin-associated protein FAM107A n=1 Tax=Poecilia mexicana TaxID=48701 RepID=A0A3B3WG09_9TELE